MIVIDQRTDDPSPGLAARKLWERLFRLTRAHEWKSLNDFLCDLKTFEARVERAYETNDGTLTFYWEYDSHSGNTWVYNDADSCASDSYKITIHRDYRSDYKIVIEENSHHQQLRTE